MDLKVLADAVTMFLAPALPFLVSGGEEAVRRAGKKVGEEGLEMAKKLWEKLRPKVEASPEAQGAAKNVVAEPDEADARAALRLQIRKLLEADPALASELAGLVNAAGGAHHAVVYGSGAIAQGPGAVAAGAGGFAVGGDVRGDLRVGRDKPHTGREPETDE
jgi:hypothetical protein